MKRVLLLVLFTVTLMCLCACSDSSESTALSTTVEAEANIPGQTDFPEHASSGLKYRINSDIFTCTITGIGECTDVYVSIGESVDGYRITAIADSAFYGNTELKGISLGKYVTSVGDYAFFGCSGLENVILSESVASLGQYAFADCGKLESLVIPESMERIGAWAFYECRGLTTVSVSSVEQWCAIKFEGVYANPVMQAEQLYIGEELLTKFVLPETVTFIGDWTFAGFKGLTEVEFHENLTAIGQRAFVECEMLTKIIYPGTVEQWKTITVGANWDSGIKEYVIVCEDDEIKG